MVIGLKVLPIVVGVRVCLCYSYCVNPLFLDGFVEEGWKNVTLNARINYRCLLFKNQHLIMEINADDTIVLGDPWLIW